MLPDRVSNSGPLTYESGALPIALRGPAIILSHSNDISPEATGLMGPKYHPWHPLWQLRVSINLGYGTESLCFYENWLFTLVAMAT